ncbi:MAG: hypothetical protein ABJZ55_23160 [Fuerstiella sp.]
MISIILIILGMTASAISYSREKDRVSNEAARVQSFVSGARDRAIFEKDMRGVRLFVEPSPPGSPLGPSAFSRTVASMAYIAPGGTWASPKDSAGIDLLRQDSNSDGDFEDSTDFVRIVRGQNNPGWWNLKRRGWLVDGLRIRIPAGPTGNWYTINTSLIDTSVAPTDDQFLLLDIPFADGGNRGQEIAQTDLTYEIELPARILPLQPLLLANGVVIDLDGSDVPDIWRPSSTGNGQYSGYMDLWFSPRGSVIGDAAANGLLHLYVSDNEDSLFLKEQIVSSLGLSSFDSLVGGGAFVPTDEIDAATTPWLTGDEAYILKDRKVVTVFGQTGGITVNNVNAYNAAGGPDDSSFAGVCNDPFLFAETGKEAK